MTLLQLLVVSNFVRIIILVTERNDIFETIIKMYLSEIDSFSATALIIIY